ALDAAAVDPRREAGDAGAVGDGEGVGAAGGMVGAVLEDLIERGARELVVDLDGGDLAPERQRRAAAVGDDDAGGGDAGQSGEQRERGEVRGELEGGEREPSTREREPPASR